MSHEFQSACPRCGSSAEDGRVDGLCARCLGGLNFSADTLLPGEEPARRLAPVPVEELAPHFPGLEILECLGRGGMGVVYRARQKSLGRMVALKLVVPEKAGDPRFAARFAREARALAALSHPNIVSVHDFGMAGGNYYLLMEYVDGVNLRQLLTERRLSPEEALRMVPPVCAALQCAHSHGIVHRDIKPENLLIDRSGTVKIADFGIAGMIETGAADDAASMAAPQGATMPMGTPDYAAPEQTSGTADHRADIYSLGVVLYEMLAGERPSPGLEPPSAKVRIDIRLDSVVLRALAQSPERRYASATDFASAVEEVAKGAPPTRRIRRRTILTAGAAAALLGAAGWWYAQGEELEFTADVEPLEVLDRAVIVVLRTSQPRPPCELRLIFTGETTAPSIPEPLQRRPAVIDFTLVPQGSYSHQQWTDFGSARELTVAFVLPSPELAREAWEQLGKLQRRRSVRVGGAGGFLRAASETLTELPLFTCGGCTAALRFSRIVREAHPRWVAIKRTGQSESGGSLRLTWEFRASRPGLVALRHGSGKIEYTLSQSDGGSPGIFRLPLSIQLTPGAAGATAECELGGRRMTVPLTGQAQELAAAFRGSAIANYLKTERDWETVLTRPGSEPFIVTITDIPP